jgi:hypothetical protein
MIKKCYSYIAAVLNHINIRHSTTTFYYYNGHQKDTISTLFMPNPLITTIQGIKLTNQWQEYIEQDLRMGDHKQDEHLTTELVNKIIVNLKQENLFLTKLRDAFYMDILKDGITHKCFLIHEYYLSPQYKLVQILEDNRVIKFDINKPDYLIESEVITLL